MTPSPSVTDSVTSPENRGLREIGGSDTRVLIMAEATEAVPISWEAVKTLAAVVGVREAARRMGLSEEQVKKRCTREGWLASPEARQANKIAREMRSGITVSPQLSPASLVHAEIAALGSKTRLGLARGIAKASDHVAELSGPEILDKSQEVKAIAQTADLVHGWKDSPAPVKIRLEVLAAPSEQPVIDVESEAVIDVSNSTITDSELDEY